MSDSLPLPKCTARKLFFPNLKENNIYIYTWVALNDKIWLAIRLEFQICFQKLNKHYFLYLFILLLISGDILEPCKAEIWSWHWFSMKRKVEGEDPEDGQRTIRRKARENRKNQQGLWFSMKKINFEVQYVLFICCIVYLTLMTDYLRLIVSRSHMYLIICPI